MLDLGCGCGAIASHIADLTGCTVHGINLDPSQIEKAWKNPNRAQLHFQVGDFNQPLAFGDAMFDAAYNVQAVDLRHGPRRDLRMLIQHTRELTAFGGFWHSLYWEAAFEQAGFEITSSEGRPAVEMIRKERALYDRYNVIAERLARMRLIPRKVDAMLQRMNTNVDSYIEAEERGLITLNWRYVVRKPT